jgi:hypothetical protein
LTFSPYLGLKLREGGKDPLAEGTMEIGELDDSHRRSLGSILIWTPSVQVQAFRSSN